MDPKTTLKDVAQQGTAKRRKYTDEQIAEIKLTEEEIASLPQTTIGDDGVFGAKWNNKWYSKEFWHGWKLEHVSGDSVARPMRGKRLIPIENGRELHALREKGLHLFSR